jgi:hypothetical protein
MVAKQHKERVIMRKIIIILTLIALMWLAMPPVSAVWLNETVSGGGATLSGPLNLLVDLGIDKIPGITTDMARVYYRWICFVLVMWVALSADRRSSTMFCVLAVAISAITAWFGWFTVTDPVSGAINPAGPWGLIILCAVLTVVAYMTESKRINFGISGAGDPLINLFVFFILFSGTIGLLNGGILWPQGTVIATPTLCQDNQYGNCMPDGVSKLTGLNTNTQTKTILDNAFDFIIGVPALVWNTVLLIVQIAVSIAFVGAIILQTYPWIKDSPGAMILLGLLQMGIWIVYSLTLARWFGKVGYGEMRV